MATSRPSTKEITEIKECFQRHDTDKDGTINPSEFKLMLLRLGILLSPTDEQKLFNMMDADKSGKIDCSEFIDHYHTILKLEKQAEEKKIGELRNRTTFTTEELKAMYQNFKKISVTHSDDGVIDKEEFRAMMLSTQMDTERNMVFYDGLFRMFDRDGSGGIDFMEFVMALALYHGKMASQTADERSKFFFSIFDVDGDGHISKMDLTKVMTDCCSANGLTLPEQHINALVEDTFKRYPSASGGKFDFATYKLIAQKKGNK